MIKLLNNGDIVIGETTMTINNKPAFYMYLPNVHRKNIHQRLYSERAMLGVWEKSFQDGAFYIFMYEQDAYEYEGKLIQQGADS